MFLIVAGIILSLTTITHQYRDIQDSLAEGRNKPQSLWQSKSSDLQNRESQTLYFISLL